jgi:hypothetical protein
MEAASLSQRVASRRAANCTARDTANLAACITSAATTIPLTSNITLTAELPAVQNNTTINGAGFTVSGNNQIRGFFRRRFLRLKMRADLSVPPH